MKKILTLILISFIVLGAGCQNSPSAISGPTKTYKVVDGSLSFTTPSAPWEEKVQSLGEVQGELGNPIPAETVLGVTFRRPDKDGMISVGVLGQEKDKDGKVIDLENDQEMLNHIAMSVEKREGKRLKEEWTQVLGVNAFHMVFEVGEDERKQKGEQVHFTKDGKHYTLAILVPAQDYDAEIGHFRNLVSSFKLEPSASAEPEKEG
ncbi:MAG: hypothetical protein KC800_03750 [Candidatus Eremiobacteraeota bacterium]|nr:hypothetical protein [Candidatus Eremiobacteraeota bacterium]